MNGTLRRVIHNVKRWQGEAMILRWVTLGVAERAGSGNPLAPTRGASGTSGTPGPPGARLTAGARAAVAALGAPRPRGRRRAHPAGRPNGAARDRAART